VMSAYPAAILFDLDGTLIDSEEVWNDALREFVRRRGTALSAEVLARTHGLTEFDAMTLVHDALGWRGRNIDVDVAWVERRVGQEYTRRLPLMAGAADLLRLLRGLRIPIGLVTSTKRHLVDLALAHLGEFDVVMCGDDTDTHKPHPGPYVTAATRMAVDVRACVAIEDSIPGITSALAAGCAVLAVGGRLPRILPGIRRVDSLCEVDIHLLTSLLA
jgi:HAD superfamily hydrolase (TIGR01509 family)